jgi:membrane protein
MTWYQKLKRHPVSRFLLRLYGRYSGSKLTLLAAALSYYAAFSLGPLILLFAGWLGVFLRARPELLAQYRLALTSFVGQLLPLQDNAESWVSQSFEVIVAQLGEGAVLRSIISVGVLVWAGSNFFTSLQLALEVIFDIPRTRGFWRKRLIAVLLIAGVALMIAVNLIGGLFTSWFNRLSLSLTLQLQAYNFFLPAMQLTWGRGWLFNLVNFAVATTVFTLGFRFLPRQASSWVGALVGAFFSTASIRLVQWFFETFFNFERFNVVYGVVTSLIVILLWLYFALLMFLTGALLVAEVTASIYPNKVKKPHRIESAIEVPS